MKENEKLSFNSAFDEMVTLDELRRMNIVESIERTVNKLYIPEGYIFKSYLDKQNNNLHIRIIDKYDINTKGDLKIPEYMIYEWSDTAGFVKIKNIFYRSFPMLQSMIKELIAKTMEIREKR